jgi:hypothetical protein
MKLYFIILIIFQIVTSGMSRSSSARIKKLDKPLPWFDYSDYFDFDGNDEFQLADDSRFDYNDLYNSNYDTNALKKKIELLRPSESNPVSELIKKINKNKIKK